MDDAHLCHRLALRPPARLCTAGHRVGASTSDPLWAASLIVAGAPLMGPIAYGTGLGLLQVLGFVLVFIGSIPAALAMLKGRDEVLSLLAVMWHVSRLE